ncbi:hypothetical protein OPV22_002144 [Ensete ventricosum]|uniref:Transcription factor TFIIIC triple barrel domain-containing protein n=1 Tax=Ensete ventricosum TaxID=4639 RepID=A0AAV8RX35_ENSVE|nr:hypothetical protein OPV22_002144 [Ensete ventricosum]
MNQRSTRAGLEPAESLDKCATENPTRTKSLLAEILRMEGSMAQINHNEDEEEYVLLDLDDVCVRADIPANAPYVLSGLNTAKPVLVIGDLKLIGEYQETVGTCYIFAEDGAPTMTCSETKPSETNVFKDKQFLDSEQAPSKQVKPMASLHKILKFKLVTEDQNEMAEGISEGSAAIYSLYESEGDDASFPRLIHVRGIQLFYSKKGIPRTNIIATRDTHVQHRERDLQSPPGFLIICCTSCLLLYVPRQLLVCGHIQPHKKRKSTTLLPKLFLAQLSVARKMFAAGPC